MVKVLLDRLWSVESPNGLGAKLSRAGARWGIGWLTYNPLVVLYYHEHARASAPNVFRTFRQTFPDARRYVDVGAGSGAYAAAGRQQGLLVAACEHSLFGRAAARCQGVKAHRFDLTKEPPARLDEAQFDVAYSFEVAEHLAPSLGDRLVTFLASLAPTVVFTSAHPGQDGQGHVNEQPPQYWMERFARAGMRHDERLSAAVVDRLRSEQVLSWWLVENLMVFVRGPAKAPAAS